MTTAVVTPEAAIRLNATLERIPAAAARWAVVKVRKFRAIEGSGYEAQVTFDGQPAGAFLNDGNGGGSYYEGGNRETHEAMRALLAAWAAVQPALGFPVQHVDGETRQPIGEPVPEVWQEHVCDALVENHTMAKKLDAMVKKGKTPVLTPADFAAADDGGAYHVEYGVKTYGSITVPVDHPQAQKIIAERKMLAWVEGAWR